MGSGYYIVEVHIENGFFRILADEIENPMTKVLEMNADDGIKLIDSIYLGEIESLVDDLIITDKIYIRKLEEINNRSKIA